MQKKNEKKERKVEAAKPIYQFIATLCTKVTTISKSVSDKQFG